MKSILSIFCLMILVPNSKVDRQIEFAQAEFERIRDFDFDKLEELYLSQEEVQDLISITYPNMPEDAIQKELDEYEKYKSRFIKDYKNTLNPLNLKLTNCDSLDIEKTRLDSIKYLYKVLKSDSKDELIKWPISRSYEPGNRNLTKNVSMVIFSDSSSSYSLQIESILYNKEWRYYRNVKAPRIYRVR